MSDRCGAYIRFFETLSPDTLERLESLVTPDVRFCDPFNDVRGVATMQSILTGLFAEVEAPRCTITDRAYAGDVCFVRWRFTGRLRILGRRPWQVVGMRQLRLAPDGRVAQHIDHWDAGAQFYVLLPVIGPIIRLLRRRVARPSPLAATR